MRRLSRTAAERCPAVPPVVYHATYRAYLPSIRAQGLLADPGHSGWDVVGPPAVYLAVDPEVAEDYAACADVDDEVLDSGVVVLSVDTAALDPDRFAADPNVLLDDDEEPATLAYLGNVPPSAISF